MPLRSIVRALALAGVVCGLAPVGADEPFVLESPNFRVVARDKAVAEKKAKALEEAGRMFTALLKEKPPHGCVKLLLAGQAGAGAVSGGSNETAPGILWTFEWFNPPPNEPKLPDDLLEHEVGHKMFQIWVGNKFKPKGAARADRYCSPMPDWLDEASAVWHEPEHMKAERRRQVRQYLDKHVAFETYFTSEHPLAADLAAGKSYGSLFQGHEEQLRIYYGQSMSVLEFLRAAGGDKLMQTFVANHADGSTTAEVLAALKVPSFKTPKLLEAAWMEWIKKNYKAR